MIEHKNCDYKKGTGRPAFEAMILIDHANLPVSPVSNTASQCVAMSFDGLTHMVSSTGLAAKMVATLDHKGRVRYSFTADGASTRGGKSRLSDLFWKFLEDAEAAHGSVFNMNTVYDGDFGLFDLWCPVAITYKPKVGDAD